MSLKLAAYVACAHKTHFWGDDLRCKGCLMGIDWPGARQSCSQRYKPTVNEVDGVKKRLMKAQNMQHVDEAIFRARFYETHGRWVTHAEMKEYRSLMKPEKTAVDRGPKTMPVVPDLERITHA